MRSSASVKLMTVFGRYGFCNIAFLICCDIVAGKHGRCLIPDGK
jgi:hypothetical protein